MADSLPSQQQRESHFCKTVFWFNTNCKDIGAYNSLTERDVQWAHAVMMLVLGQATLRLVPCAGRKLHLQAAGLGQAFGWQWCHRWHVSLHAHQSKSKPVTTLAPGCIPASSTHPTTSTHARSHQEAIIWLSESACYLCNICIIVSIGLAMTSQMQKKK